MQIELENAERALAALADADHLAQPKTLILVSSVMTWARTPVEMVSCVGPLIVHQWLAA